MKIGGPFLDKSRRNSPKRWYLSYFVPKLDEKGSPVLVDGKPVIERKRPYYESKDAAQEDKPRILAQYGAAGAGQGILTRTQVDEYEQAKAEVSEVSLVEVAKFWRLHHPRIDVARVRELVPRYLKQLEARAGEVTKHIEDLKSRLGIFVEKFGDRIPETIERKEFIEWLFTYPGEAKAGRTVVNLKQSVCSFFNWMADDAHAVTVNRLAGIKRNKLPKVTAKEIQFLALDHSEAYLRACERYDPELVAHEIIQLLAGVRADDEMENFDGAWVLPETREIVIPAEIAKTEKREVLNELEECFWQWWEAYGRKGILRTNNYPARWVRIRTLATIKDRRRADAVARMSYRELAKQREAKDAVKAWPWNGRRRTFCTFHVAKHQSADKTVLIMRHRGDTYTLHNSYRGLGVTQLMGEIYFSRLPQKVADPILPPLATREPRGMVRFRLERKAAAAAEKAQAAEAS